jgi:hypothetical protein
MKKRVVIFLDIDGVISVGWCKSKLTKWGLCPPLDKKCCDVLNALYDEIPYEIVISSDWRNQFSINNLREMFAHYNIKAPVIDITPNSGGYTPTNLEGGRIEEITLYLERNKDEILAWVAVDDLLMFQLEYFVCCPKWMQGIKQTGIKEKIIKELKLQINGK